MEPLWGLFKIFMEQLWGYQGKKCTFMEHFKIVNVCCFYIQISINISTNVLTFYFLGFQKGTLFLELKLNHCSLLLFVSCCTHSSCIFWEIMGFLKNYVANMGQIAKKLRKSSIYGAALKLCSLLVTLSIHIALTSAAITSTVLVITTLTLSPSSSAPWVS